MSERLAQADVGGALVAVVDIIPLAHEPGAGVIELVLRTEAQRRVIRVHGVDREDEALAGIGVEADSDIAVDDAAAHGIALRAAAYFEVPAVAVPDVIESGLGNAAVIKSHHNVGGLPDCVDFKEIVEPLRRLFKDEVRQLGTELGLPDELVWRQPFPGPGLGVRIIGEITAEKVRILQEADWVLRDEMAKTGYETQMAQFFCVLPGVSTVGVMGDHRTYDHLLAIRAVTTDDFMTADWARIPYDLLAKVSNRITNEVKHINRVVYDVTSKPPATVEWE